MKSEIEYLFSINTGRSGSDYLTRIFEHVSRCRACHEPHPIGNGQAMRQFARGRPMQMKRIAEEKASVIGKTKRENEVYFESNHCFIKGFGWLLPEYIPEEKTGVIILKRDEEKIAESTLRIKSTPLTPYGRDWVNTPEMKNPIVPPPRSRSFYHFAHFMKFLYRVLRNLGRNVFGREPEFPRWLHEYELACVRWYVEETHAKAGVYKRKFPAMKYYEVNIEELNSLEAVKRMLDYFGLEGKDSLKDVVGKPTNLKRKETNRIENP